MRFSIRDLLWLMAVVAVAATLYAARMEIQQRAARWAAEQAAQEQQFAAEKQKLIEVASRLDHENALLKHQMTLRLQEDLRREAAELERRSPNTFLPDSPKHAAPVLALPEDAGP